MKEKLIYCGKAKEQITPNSEMLAKLRAPGNRRFGNVLDEIYARVIALNSQGKIILLISFDLLYAPCPQKVFHLISEHTGISEEQIFYLGTHTHSAPLINDLPFERGMPQKQISPEIKAATDEYEVFLINRIMFAIDSALDNMKPVRIGFGSGESYINVNRSEDYVVWDKENHVHHDCSIGYNALGPVNREVWVMKVEDYDGNVMALLVNYAVHCVATIWNDYGDNQIGLSGDIAGNVSRFLEAKYKGAVAIWSSGAAGDINPVMSNQLYYPDPATGLVKLYKVMGQDMAVAMLTVLASRHFSDILQTVKAIDCTVEELQVHTYIRWLKLPANDISVTEGRRKVVQKDSETPYQVRMHMLRINEVTVCGVSGEMYCSLGLAMQKAYAPDKLIIVNHDASLLADTGYIFDDETIHRCDNTNGGNRPVAGFNQCRMQPGYAKDALIQAVIEYRQGVQNEKQSGDRNRT